MSVCPSDHLYCVNISKTLRLRDRWTDVIETWHVYSVGLGTQLLGSRILNFGPSASRGHAEHSLVQHLF